MIKPTFVKIIIAVLILIILVVVFFEQILTAILLVTTCTRVNYDYVEERGGMSLGSPIVRGKIYYLPIKCNAAGEIVTKKPKTFTSAPIVYYKAIVKQDDKDILFYLKSRFDNTHQQTKINEVILGNLKPDRYKIYYLNEDGKKTYLKTILVELGGSPS